MNRFAGFARRAIVILISLQIGIASAGTPEAGGGLRRSVPPLPPTRLVVASGHSPAFAWVRVFRDVFLPSLERRLADTPHRIEWREAYSGSVAKLGGVLETIEVGIVEVGLVATVFEASKLPLQNLTYFTPFGPQDPGVVAEVILELQQRIPALEEAWAQHNVVAIGGFAVESYDLYSTTPIRRVADLAGRKILAPGPAANWIRGTGAVAVAGDLSTYYSDLKTGVADGVLTLATGAFGARLYEVARYRTEVGLGAQFVGAVVVNRDTWDAFPSPIRDAMRAAGVEYSARQSSEQRDLAGKRLRQMEEMGLERVPLDAGERAKWARALPNIAGDWAELLESRGLPAWTLLTEYRGSLRARGIRPVRDWSRRD